MAVLNRQTLRMGVVAVVAVAVFRWLTNRVPALQRLGGIV